MSTTAFDRLVREENEREDQIERAREERESVVTHGWRFQVSHAKDGVWLHVSVKDAVLSGCELLKPHEAERLAQLLFDAAHRSAA